MVAFFRGKLAFALKVAFLAGISALLVLLLLSAFGQKQYAIGIFLILVVIGLNFTYLTKVSIPLKFFYPGLIFLLGFVVAPIVFTLTMSTYNYKTGNYIGKTEAISQIQKLAIEPDANGSTFDIVVGKYKGTESAILASDTVRKLYFISTYKERIDLTAADLQLNEYQVATKANNFAALPEGELAGADKLLSTSRFFYTSEFFIALEGFDIGALYRQKLNFVSDKDEFQNISTGAIYRDNGKGNYANVDNSAEILEPGWRAPIWIENYSKLLLDPKVREPLIRVFIWTVVFALSSVVTAFGFGLLLALALNKPIRGRRFYRSILILPYAMPSVMSILIWGGMFNTEFGAINELFGTQVAWFQSVTFARIAVVVVNLWLGFPYFYLVSSGALQAIPSELNEAAAIDGASPRQVFSKITLPLLLRILSPLLIASFAFNFNNFNLIYLLTGGGPKSTLDGDIAGATDILISYTYQIAFGSFTQDLGLASAISVIIFLLVASISLYGIRKSKVLDSFV
ncbi:MAG: ABC transporter permease subunit [Acidobacteria bacterium]|nr:ABC transporter permease subunit [Acidobacteriota bacterium]